MEDHFPNGRQNRLNKTAPELGVEFASRRSPVYATRGLVAASQPLAVAAGLETLAQGGNAADAAVATAAALNVTEPGSTGLGGDCFALYFDATSGQVSALNGSGRAPAGLTLERLRDEGFRDELPPYHAYTITAPGACAGWCDLVERYGRLPLSAVLAPAIRLAEGGFPVAPLTAHYWGRGAQRQLKSAPGGRELTIEGRAPRPGEIFRNPGLARSLQAVAEGGAQAFYQGLIAEAIVAAVQSAGGCLGMEDLAAHHSTWEQPISVDYRGLRLWECPPNGQGLTALLALNILEGFDLADMPPLSAGRLHLEIEALRLAFADTRWYVADPAFNPAPLQALLSKEYAAGRRAWIDPAKANLEQGRGAPSAGSDTVYLSVVDGEGNACSFINSNYMGFGTGIVPLGWGFSLQNRGHNFSLDPAHPNALAPGKRPYHTIIPALATRPSRDGADELFACFGVMGGFMQPQGHLQVFVALVDDALDPQSALDRPRFCISDGSAGGGVALEQGIPVETMAALAEMGHPVVPTSGYERAVFGRGQVILRDAQSGVLCGGSDPRADGCVMSY
ncbi:MAG: gamma-glutamyltransferase family protein [Anaerolineales bacterium]|nr:gamma-glutamyltransferase family protein [Anaerolineales bacterium]